MTNEICEHCGISLDGEIDYVLPDGSKRGRCSRCFRPYVISDSGSVPDPNPGPSLDPAE